MSTTTARRSSHGPQAPRRTTTSPSSSSPSSTAHTHTPESSSSSSPRSPRSASSPKSPPGLTHSPSPPPVPAFEIPEPAPDNAGPYHDPIAPFRGLLSGLRLTPGEGTFLQAMLRLPHNAEPRPKTTHNSLNILDDTWYLQERLENPSPNSYFSRIDRKWLQFRDGQIGDAAAAASSAAARSASFSSTSSYASSQPKTPTGSQGFDPIFRIPGYPDAKLDDKWLQYDDPWFVYDEDEDEVTTDEAPAKKRRVEFAPEPPKKAKVAQETEELAPPPGWEEFVHLDQAWEIWNKL